MCTCYYEARSSMHSVARSSVTSCPLPHTLLITQVFPYYTVVLCISFLAPVHMTSCQHVSFFHPLNMPMLLRHFLCATFTDFLTCSFLRLSCFDIPHINLRILISFPSQHPCKVYHCCPCLGSTNDGRV